MINAVITVVTCCEESAIRQISNPRLEVTGGDMARSAAGRIWSSARTSRAGYIPFTTGPPSFTQIYSDEIRSFQIVDKGKTLAITCYQALRDPTNFRRRDGNMGSGRMPNGQQGLTYYGGVFTPGQ